MTLEQVYKIVDRMPGNYMVCKAAGTKLQCLYYTRGIPILSGMGQEEYTNIENPYDLVIGEDEAMLHSKLKDCLNADGFQETDMLFRLFHKEKGFVWVRMIVKQYAVIEDCTIYIANLLDATKETMASYAMMETSDRYNPQKWVDVVLDNSELIIWEYDMVNHRCINSKKAVSEYNAPLVIENYPESLLETGRLSPENIEQLKDVKRRLENGETGFSVERKFIDKYGKVQWQKVEYTLECDKNGKPIRAIACGLVITAQKELEQKYEEQIEYRNKLAENAMFSIRLDLDDNTISDYTSSLSQLTDMVKMSSSAADFLQHFFRTSEFDAESHVTQKLLTIEELKETYALGQSQYQTIYRCSILDLYLDLNLTMYKNPFNNHLEVFYVITNATEKVLMQNAFQSVVSQDYDFVAVINTVTAEIFYLAHSEDVVLPERSKEHPDDYDSLVIEFSQSFRESYHSEEDYRAASEGILLANIVKQLKSMSVYKFNCKTKAKDGQIQTYRLSFRYSDSTQRQIVFTRVNITKAVQEERRKQEMLERTLQAAKAADRAKTEFLSRMSHDMRTPMNGIIGMTYLTQDIANLPTEAQDNLAAISESGRYLLQLINDTLDMNKIESNKLTLNAGTVNAKELIQHILSTIAPLAEQKGIQLEFVPIHAELDYIRTDRVRLQQLFLNILSNAIKFTPEGGSVRWEVETLKRENQIAYCRVSVEDNGCGMSENFLKHIFEPFTQERSQVTNGEEGTGLGMSIVKSLVALMDGRIEIESRPGKGTKVTIFLHFMRVYNLPAEEETLSKIDESEKLYGKHVLLVEDHPVNATIAKRMLEKKDMIVEHAENGMIAVEMFARSKIWYYDAVLMDIRMPKLDGLQATRAIRALGRDDAKAMPVIAMTANAYIEDVKEALEAGMNGHLAKPIEPKALYGMLAKEIIKL